jgi:hypothetical protein
MSKVSDDWDEAHWATQLKRWREQGRREREERRRQADLARADLRQFWAAVPFPPVPALEELRRLVLEINPRRCPKWAFRLADNFLVQLQPRPCLLAPAGQTQEVLRFEGAAVASTEPVVAKTLLDSFKTLPRGSDHVKLTFFLRAVEGEDSWTFKAKGVQWRRKHPAEVLLHFKGRLLREVPTVLSGLSPEKLLRPACMVCGKALTDPASLARMTGPECWGSSGLVVPWVRRRK